MSDLKERCRQTKELINSSIDWLEENIDSDEARPVLSNLKDLRADSRNLELFADQRPTLAVFGESQIGKSYFMSELLKNKKENKFYLKFKSPPSQYKEYFSNDYLDFLTRVNPSGPKESSGIVTRFTINDDKQKPDAQIPVKFLRQVELAIILADTYALDVKDTSELDDYEYNEVVGLLQQLSSSRLDREIDGMDENDVVDFKNYLNKYLKDSSMTVVMFNKNKIWDDLIRLLPRISYSERYRIFELFWGRIPVFTQIFNALSDVLKKINFTKEGFLELNALLPKEVNSQSCSVIDVSTVEDFLHRESLRMLNIHTPDGIVPNIGIGAVSAIVKEISLTVDNRILNDDNRKFLNDVDVFDFPGARGRKNYNVSRLQSLATFTSDPSDEENILHECIVRGKVHYLFNHYSDMNDVTTLIFAQKNSNQEVNYIPKLIDNWVMNTHGDTAEKRIGKETNLFISFHYFNLDLNGKTGDLVGEIEQYNALWKSRFYKNVEQFVGTQIRENDNWILEWTPGNRFQNFFFLRDPDRTFNSATSINANGKEEYEPGYQQKHQDMKQSFLSYEYVKKYVKDPLELWENTAALNNTGTEYIVKNITPVTTINRREEQIINKLDDVLKVAAEKIVPFFKSGDYEEEQRVVQQKTNDALRTLLIAMKTKNSFGNFLYDIELEEDLAWKTLYDVQNPIFNHTISEDGTIKGDSNPNDGDNSNLIDVNIDEIGVDLGIEFEDFDILDDTEVGGIDIHSKNKTKAEIFVDKLLANWTEYTEERFNNNELRRLGITKEAANWVSINMKDSFLRIGFKQFMANKIDTEIERYIQNTDSIFLVSRMSKNYFNEFINTFGWNHIPLEKRPIMKDGSILFAGEEKGKKTNHYVKPLVHDDIKLDNDFPGMSRLNHWLKGFQEASKENLHFRYSDGGVISNPEANTKLGSIIESFNKLS